MPRKVLWIALGLALALAIVLGQATRTGGEMAFLSNLGADRVDSVREVVAPNRANEAIRYLFPSRRAGEVVDALRRYGQEHHYRTVVFPGLQGQGEMDCDPESVYNITWRTIDRQYPPVDSKMPPVELGALAVYAFRKETFWELKLHLLKRYLHLERS